MKTGVQHDLKHIESREFHLWILTVVIILTLASVTVGTYYFIVSESSRYSMGTQTLNYRALGGLGILIALFCLYILNARFKLSRLKSLLEEHQQNIRLLKERIENVVTSVPLGMIILSGDLRVMSANLRSREMLGQPDAELRGQQLEKILPVSNLREIADDVSTTDLPHRDISVEIKHESGLRYLEMTVAGIKRTAKDQAGILVVLENISERKKAEENLRAAHKKLQETQATLVQSEKMASIGQLAAGVAHEINNPVGFIMSNLGTLKDYVGIFKKLLGHYDGMAASLKNGEGTPEARKILEQIEELCREEDLPFILQDVDELIPQSIDGTERVKEIVQNLKSFARVDESELKEANINDGIEATLRIVWNELKYKHKVHKKFGQIPTIRCYPGQLNQVFMNLIVNAAQAMPDGGDVTIETEATPSDIIVQISDTGQGISQEQLPMIFNPFFTTKPVGKGTGLGLSISYGIIKKHNGTIDVQSEVGKGTTFRIQIPIEGDRQGTKE